MVRGLVLSLVLGMVSAAGAQVPTGERLPGTTALELTEPLDVVMVAGINRFAEQELARTTRERDPSQIDQDQVASRREKLRELIGAVDPRVPPRLQLAATRRFAAQQETSDVLIEDVSWDVIEGVTAEGLLLRTAGNEVGNGDSPAGLAILLPDAGTPPEELAGLTGDRPPEHQVALRLARAGCIVLIPDLIGRHQPHAKQGPIRPTNIPAREHLYRVGFELGRTPAGFEVQKVQAAIDWYHSLSGAESNTPVIVAGEGEGGRLAFLSAALDDRITVTLVSGYFDERTHVWKEPIDRNVWQQLKGFGDAAIARLIAPRRLILENAQVLKVSPPAPLPSGADYAAPGHIETPAIESVRREFDIARRCFGKLGVPEQVTLVDSTNSASFAPAARQQLFAAAGLQDVQDVDALSDADKIDQQQLAEFAAARQTRQVDELVRHSQRLLHRSDKVRDAFWSKVDRSSVDAWVNSSRPYRETVHTEMIGRLDFGDVPANPRSRRVIDEPTHVGYEVLLDVGGTLESPDDADSAGGTATEHAAPHALVIAGGILLIPKDLHPGERRPVVVCQHGLEGTPWDTITTDQSSRAWRAYKGFSTQLVRQGYIVYAPQNPYRGEHDFRVIQRKSNPLGRSLFSYIIEQHRQTLRWLATLPYVDAGRIGFYGLSYGGKTAVRVPPLLHDSSDVQYALSICSADFNEWIRKNVSAEDRYSYVYTKEYEMFEWNMGHLAGYAELSWLMAPRPLMVERGHDDGVAPDEWVAWEYAKVREHYDRLGIGNRTEIEWFLGPHTINGDRTFEFLRKHLGK